MATEVAEHHHYQSTPGPLRDRRDGEHQPVTTFELFFDLVFVFAVTQLAHHLAVHLTLRGGLETLLLLFAVWWVWMYTTWATNWLDPNDLMVRLMLIAVMLGGLVMSAALPEAFDGRALAFALPYVLIQVGRSLCVLGATRADPGLRKTFQLISIWFSVSGIVWLAGCLVEGDLRFAFWLTALAIDYAGPSAAFWVPGLGRSATTDWSVEGSHLAERCGLFMIIALGESLLVTGATFAGLSWGAATVTAMVAAFGMAVALWWLYFDVTAEVGLELIAHTEDPGRLARLAYTYIHLPMVAGIILAAVGDERVLAHPTGDTSVGVALVILGGPAVFLAGHWFFKRAIAGHFVVPHPVGIALLALLFIAYPLLSPIALSAASTVIAVVIAAWWRMFPHEQLEPAPEPATAAR